MGIESYPEEKITQRVIATKGDMWWQASAEMKRKYDAMALAERSAKVDERADEIEHLRSAIDLAEDRMRQASGTRALRLSDCFLTEEDWKAAERMMSFPKYGGASLLKLRAESAQGAPLPSDADVVRLANAVVWEQKDARGAQWLGEVAAKRDYMTEVAIGSERDEGMEW